MNVNNSGNKHEQFNQQVKLLPETKTNKITSLFNDQDLDRVESITQNLNKWILEGTSTNQINRQRAANTINYENNQEKKLLNRFIFFMFGESRHLYLQKNNLETLPKSIGNLTILSTLHLEDNLLNSLPTTIANLSALVVLDLEFNQLQSLPNTFGQLRTLQHLNISYNPLGSVPEPIRQLTSLKTLKLKGIQLQTLPGWIEELKSLEFLTVLSNKLKSLPETIGNLENLNVLDVRDNRLLQLPKSIGNLKNLSTFSLVRNQSLLFLPLSLVQCTRLRNFEVNDSLKSEADTILQRIYHGDKISLNTMEHVYDFSETVLDLRFNLSSKLFEDACNNSKFQQKIQNLILNCEMTFCNLESISKLVNLKQIHFLG